MSDTTRRPRRCGECRHWAEEEWSPGRRVCRRIHAHDGPQEVKPVEKAHTVFSDGWLITAAAFGCVLFERRQD